MKPRILSFDPGKANMGIAVVELHKRKPVCLANSVMSNPLQTLTGDYITNLESFLIEVDSWVQEFKPNALIMERFQSRGNKGTTIECVSIMIGALTVTYNMPTKLVIASTWKNAFNRKHGERIDEIYRVCRTQPHQLDATMIGVYGIEIGLNIETEYNIDDMLDNIESTSRMPLHNRRALC